MTRRLKLVGLLAAAVIGCAAADGWTWPSDRPIRVIDGDTVMTAGGESIRLVGYDTPETHFSRCDAEYELGMRAKHRLQELVKERKIRIERIGELDRYGRTLAKMFADERNVADIMVSEGLAASMAAGHRRPDWCRWLAGRAS